MDPLPEDLNGGDVDLDALMVRVREAAMNGGTNAVASPAPPAGDLTGGDVDLMRVIDAQSEWNEHTRKSLAALVDSLRTLRDDWTDAHSRIRQEVERLSADLARVHPVNGKHERRKATRRRVDVTRRRPGKAHGRKP